MRVKESLQVGALSRRHFRATFDTLNVPWIEHKGLLDSIFVIEVTPLEWNKIVNWARDNGFWNPPGNEHG